MSVKFNNSYKGQRLEEQRITYLYFILILFLYCV